MIDSTLSTLVRIGRWAERTSRDRNADRLAVVPASRERIDPLVLIAALFLVSVLFAGLSLALASGKTYAAERDGMTATERVIRLFDAGPRSW